MCGIIGVFKHEGDANVEIYEGLLGKSAADIEKLRAAGAI